MNASFIGRFIGAAARLTVDTTVSVSKSVVHNAKELGSGIAEGYKAEPAQPVATPVKAAARKPRAARV